MLDALAVRVILTSVSMAILCLNDVKGRTSDVETCLGMAAILLVVTLL